MQPAHPNLHFPLCDATTAPVAARAPLTLLEKTFGEIPDLLAAMANAPELLQGYLALSRLFAATTFSRVEQEVVLLAVSVENDCDFCIAAHTDFALAAGLDESHVGPIQERRSLGDERLATLRDFTAAFVQARGRIDDAALDAFLDAGFTSRNLLEVVLGTALKTLSNYTDHLVRSRLA